MNKLVIFTLSWNGLDKLQKLYPTLINSLQDIEFIWFIKDNGSKDNSIEWLKELNDKRIHIVKTAHNNHSYSQGNNILFNEASPGDEDFVMLLNNDIIFNDSNSIKNMISIINNDSNVGIVGSKLNYTNTNRLQHAGVIFDRMYNMLPFHHRPNEIEDDNAKKDREFQSVTGALLLTKADFYKYANKNNDGMNGLNQNLLWSFDDIDLCLSVKYNMDKKIVYCGQTNVYHEESASLKKNPQHKLFMKHNIETFVNKWSNRYKEDHHLYLKDRDYNLHKRK
jgi:GT2 family glycosyltransferase